MKVCRECGIEIPQRKQLCDTCRTAIKAVEGLTRPPERMVVCSVCGNGFTTRIRRQKYCSARCRDEVNRIRSREFYQDNYLVSRRFDVLFRDSFKCRYCGKTGQDGVKLEVDHVIPVSNGGSNLEENLVTSCSECNRGKSDRVFPNLIDIVPPLK